MSTQAIQAQEVPKVLVSSINQGIIEAFSQIFEATYFTGRDNLNEGCDGIAVIISFLGDFPCSVIMTFPESTVVAMTEKFAGFEIPYESEDMIDAAGELLNIAAGPITANIKQAGMETHMSLPTVVRGKGLEMALSGHIPLTRLHYDCPHGSFHVKILTAQK